MKPISQRKIETIPEPAKQNQSVPATQFNTIPQPTSFLPSVPDQEEQEALTQLLLAWYQAGYAAGRYASIRQRK
jgi:hypothetical protein